MLNRLVLEAGERITIGLAAGREFEKLLLSNAGQALLAANRLLAAVRSN